MTGSFLQHRYRQASAQILRMLSEQLTHGAITEKAGLDEVFLDVTSMVVSSIHVPVSALFCPLGYSRTPLLAMQTYVPQSAAWMWLENATSLSQRDPRGPKILQSLFLPPIVFSCHRRQSCMRYGLATRAHPLPLDSTCSTHSMLAPLACSTHSTLAPLACSHPSPAG